MNKEVVKFSQREEVISEIYNMQLHDEIIFECGAGTVINCIRVPCGWIYHNKSKDIGSSWSQFVSIDLEFNT